MWKCHSVGAHEERERETWFFCHTDGEKEVRGGGREALALQMVCQLHPNNKHTNRCLFPLPVWITLRLYHPQQLHKQTPPPFFFSALSQRGEVTSSSSDLNPTLPEMLLWTVWRSCYVSLHGLFLAPQHGKQRKKKKEGEEVMWVRERGSQDSPLVGSVWDLGALGPFGWLTLNGCPGEVTRLIENRLRGEGNAFAARLASWPTVQRLPWQLWNPTYLFARLWRERAERLSE